jgi:hypothetical protein
VRFTSVFVQSVLFNFHVNEPMPAGNLYSAIRTCISTDFFTKIWAVTTSKNPAEFLPPPHRWPRQIRQREIWVPTLLKERKSGEKGAKRAEATPYIRKSHVPLHDSSLRVHSKKRTINDWEQWSDA